MKNTLVALASALAVAITLNAEAGNRKKPVIKPASEVKWTPLVPELGARGPMISVVFGDLKKGPVGLLLKNPPGARPGVHTHSSDYWAVVVNGTMQDFAPGEGAKAANLGAGSWWMQPGKAAHDNHCTPGGECLLFAYFPKGFDFAPVAAAKMK